jgi:DMSO/TMAO reductase YedYZ heme-binding membrane subunit
MTMMSFTQAQATSVAIAARAAVDPTLWYFTRAAAVAAYVFLTLTVTLGLLRSMLRIGRARSPWLFWLSDETHQFLALLTTGFVAIHLLALLFDPLIPFSLTNLLVPLNEPYRPVAAGLGVLSLYGLGLVLLTSWGRKRLSHGVWRTLHFLSFPAFALVTLHGVLAGTDTSQPWMLLLYLAAGALFAFLIILRFLVMASSQDSRQVSA